MKLNKLLKREETLMRQVRKSCSSPGRPVGVDTRLLCACDRCRYRVASHETGRHFWKMRKDRRAHYGRCRRPGRDKARILLQEERHILLSTRKEWMGEVVNIEPVFLFSPYEEDDEYWDDEYWDDDFFDFD